MEFKIMSNLAKNLKKKSKLWSCCSPENAFNTFINKGERTSLKSISPHLEPVGRSESLAAESGRSLLSPTYDKYTKTKKITKIQKNDSEPTRPPSSPHLAM